MIFWGKKKRGERLGFFRGTIILGGKEQSERGRKSFFGERCRRLGGDHFGDRWRASKQGFLS